MKTLPLSRSRWLAALLALLLTPAVVSALSLVPPDFNQLVDESDSIFQGEVLYVGSGWKGSGADRHIVSNVQFRVIRVLKGSAPNPQTLEVFGGTVNDRSMRIPGLPQFKVGDNLLLFVKDNGKTICPLVGIYHGLLRVSKDAATGTERLALHDGTPLTDTKQIGRSTEAAAPAATDAAGSAISGMTVVEMGQRIQSRLQGRSDSPASSR